MIRLFGQIHPGDGPGRDKNRWNRGSSKGPFLQIGRIQQQTGCISVIWKHLVRNVVIFDSNCDRLLCGKVLNLHLFCVISTVVKGRSSHKRFRCLKIFIEFFCSCIYSTKAGYSDACICMETQLFSIYYWITCWMLRKTCRLVVLIAPRMCLGFSARSDKGWIRGGAKRGNGVTPSPKDFLSR